MTLKSLRRQFETQNADHRGQHLQRLQENEVETGNMLCYLIDLRKKKGKLYQQLIVQNLYFKIQNSNL